MKKILNLIILIILCGCNNPSYKITQDGIKRNKPIQDGFDMIEIFVTEFNKEGRPLNYTEGQSVFCGPTRDFSGFLGESLYSQKEKELISMNQNKMDTIMTLNRNIIGGKGHNKRISEYINSQNTLDSIVNEKFPFKAQKTILFFENNKNYKWVYYEEKAVNIKFFDYSKKVLDELPMELKKNQWYLLDFSNASNIIDEVFFFIKEDGEIKQYDYYEVLWGV